VITAGGIPTNLNPSEYAKFLLKYPASQGCEESCTKRCYRMSGEESRNVCLAVYVDTPYNWLHKSGFERARL
jgi:hypothetical protein